MSFLLLSKWVQSPAVYQPDLVVGPMQGRLELGLALTRRARQCWQLKCYNNVYYARPTDPDKLLDTVVFHRYFLDPRYQKKTQNSSQVH